MATANRSGGSYSNSAGCDNGRADGRRFARCGDGSSGRWYGINDPGRPRYQIPVCGTRASVILGAISLFSILLMGAL